MKAIVCIVYVSEGRSTDVIQTLLQMAKSFALNAKPSFAHSFRDPFYNRTSFFFVSPVRSQVQIDLMISNLLSFCGHAFHLFVTQYLNISSYIGHHPTKI
jgi:hypothetical protein